MRMGYDFPTKPARVRPTRLSEHGLPGLRRMAVRAQPHNKEGRALLQVLELKALSGRGRPMAIATLVASAHVANARLRAARNLVAVPWSERRTKMLAI
jgi:hypothetical protein